MLDTAWLKATADRMRSMSDAQAARPRKPGAWCAKEIVGQLIDSALNNHRRITLAQQRDDLVFDGYDQEAWVRLHRYNEMEWHSLVDRWLEFNMHLARAASLVPSSVLDEPRRTHSLDRTAFRAVPPDQPTTLRYLIEDYVAHLGHHLRQVWECERA